MLARVNSTRHDLTSCLALAGESANRQLIVQEPGLTMVYLSMAPGQGMPVHNHPGCTVAIQGMHGESTVLLDGEKYPLAPLQLLTFSGELSVSPRNESEAAAAVLITLSETP